jgi:hypothetical protein
MKCIRWVHKPNSFMFSPSLEIDVDGSTIAFNPWFLLGMGITVGLTWHGHFVLNAILFFIAWCTGSWIRNVI